MKNYEIFTPVVNGDPTSSFPLDHSEDRLVKYVIEPSNKEEHAIDCFHHIPFFLDPDDKPWKHGNLFIRNLIFKHKDIGKSLNVKTIDKYAQSLKLFMNYCESESPHIHYLLSKSIIKSPIARYKRNLEDLKALRKLSVGTIKGRLSHIVAFYRYLTDDLKLEFKSCPWGFDINGLHVFTGRGYSSTKEYTTSTIQRVKGSSKTSEEKTYEGCLNDGGEELRPLSDDETRIVFQALKEIGNVEMLLSHTIILATGARTQTIFTLRQCHFEYEPNKIEQEIIIRAGSGELVDSKGSRPFTIRMPIAVYRKVQTYIKSPNAQARYKKAKFQFANPTHQYVFLTTHGNPFFMANDDHNKIQYRNPPEGGTLRTFISAELKPKMAGLGFENPKDRFKFHYLRATFGLGILNSFLNSQPDDIPAARARDNAMLHVKRYMNHRSMSVTELYLNFRANSTIGKEVGSRWGEYLTEIAGL
jgi:integrase